MKLLINDAAASAASLLLAHGAGAGMDTPFMEVVAGGLCAQGITVVRFEFPYMDRRRREGTRGAPDAMPVLERAFQQAVSEAKPRSPLFVGGKSMGARVAAQVADACAARGVVALGYPFHPPGRPDKLRLAALQRLALPCLIVQGTRDRFGLPEEVKGYGLPEQVAIHWSEDGDHSLSPRKASGRTLAQNLEDAVAAVAAFIARVGGRGLTRAGQR